jgi:hypothetical protein
MACKSNCEDLNCAFKNKSRTFDGAKDECALDTSDAIMFFKRFNFTTCEIGMGERLIGDEQLTKNVISRLKGRGRM